MENDQHHEEQPRTNWGMVAFIGVIIARATGAITTSWWIVLAPIWVPVLALGLSMWYLIATTH